MPAYSNRAIYDLSDWGTEFTDYFDYQVRDPITELLRGMKINPRQQSSRSGLSKYVKLGLIDKQGTRYPNTTYTMNFESKEYRQWGQWLSSWKSAFQSKLQFGCSWRITPNRVLILRDLVEQYAPRRFGVCIDLEIVKGIVSPLVISERVLPKALFKKVSFLGEVGYIITDEGLDRFLAICRLYTPQLNAYFKDRLAGRRRYRQRQKTLSTTIEEKGFLFKQIGHAKRRAALEQILPNKVADEQAQWESCRALEKLVITEMQPIQIAERFCVHLSTVQYALRIAKRKQPIEKYFSEKNDLERLSRLLAMRVLRYRAIAQK